MEDLYIAAGIIVIVILGIVVYLLTDGFDNAIGMLQNVKLSVNDTVMLASKDNTSVLRIIMQSDGNLVLYKSTLSPPTTQNGSPLEAMTVLWSSGTRGANNYAVMQGDGNLVVYSSASKALWASNTAGNTGKFTLQLQSEPDGMMIMNNGVPFFDVLKKSRITGGAAALTPAPSAKTTVLDSGGAMTTVAIPQGTKMAPGGTTTTVTIPQGTKMALGGTTTTVAIPQGTKMALGGTTTVAIPQATK